jgi:hypothetical protein
MKIWEIYLLAYFSESLGLWTWSIVRDSKQLKTRRFGNWICFRLQVRGGRFNFGSVVFLVIIIPDDGQGSQTQ